jgi:hypothetical protein
MEGASETGAMNAIYERHERAVDEYITRLASVERQRGAVFAIHGRVVGVELFDRAVAWRRLMPKLVGSYAIEAIDQEPRADGGLSDSRAFPGCRRQREEPDVSGCRRRNRCPFRGRRVHGAALVRDGVLVHLAAFARALDANAGA